MTRRYSDPWDDVARAKWDPTTATLHDREAHKRWSPSAWPTCPRCSTLAVEWHDSHGLAHLVPADARYRHDQEKPL